MTRDDVIIMTIAGVASGGVNAKYCFPSIPDYASGSSNYYVGMAEPPQGVSSRWEPLERQVSIGQFRVRLFANVGPFSWYKQNPRPVGRVLSNVSTSDTTINVEKDNSLTGIAVGDDLYIDRETVEVTSAGAANNFFGVDNTPTRNKAGSLLQTHAQGTLVYASPPAFKGRLVTIYRTPRTGGDVSDETVIARGYVAEEPSSDLWFTDMVAQERYGDTKLNKNPRAWEVHVWVPRTGAYAGRLVAQPNRPIEMPEGGFVAADRGSYHNANGAYFYVPSLKSVFEVPRSTGQVEDYWDLDQRIVDGDGGNAVGMEVGADNIAQHVGYQVAWSNELGSFPTFGYDPSGGFVASDNPVDVVLNLLVSTEAGGNAAAGRWDWDRGTLLAPDMSLQVDESLIDWDAFERARAELDVVRADMFWLGGPKSVRLDEQLDRILGLWGYAVGTRRDGVWTVIRFADVYPADSPIAITQEDVADAEGTEFTVLGRPMDNMRIGVDPGPDGEARVTVRVEDLINRDVYPDEIGEEVELDSAPYSIGQFAATGSNASAMVGFFLHRFASRLATVSLVINDRHIDEVEVGKPVTMLDLVIVDSRTGVFLTLSSAPLKGIITSVSAIDLYDGTARVTVMVVDSGKVGSFGPAAQADTSPWNDTTKTVTCKTRRVTTQGTNDCERFAVGDRVMLLDADGQLRSDDGTAQTLPVVDAVTATTLDLDTHFLTTGGAQVDPVENDWVVHASWDGGLTVQQQSDYAFAADSGPGEVDTLPSLGSGGDEPFVYGF